MANNYVCAPLRSRSGFEDYIDAINATTNFNLTGLEGCRREICTALYGAGNPDIAGPGVSAGYVMANGIAAVCAIFWILAMLIRNEGPQTLGLSILRAMCSAFFDSATVLCFTIQLASTVILVQADFGLNADGMGSATMDLAWAASLLTLFPLLMCFIPHLCDTRDGQPTRDWQCSMENYRQAKLRIYLYILCWLLSIYPAFMSRMFETFPSKPIGDGPGDVNSEENFAKLEDLCLDGVHGLTSVEETAAKAFGIGGWLWTTSWAIYVLLEFVAEHFPSEIRSWLFPPWRSVLPSPNSRVNDSCRRQSAVGAVALLGTLVWSAGETWIFFRQKRYQEALSHKAGIDYGDNMWTFGQVAAIAVFAPVLVQLWYAWRTSRLHKAAGVQRP